ncbi:MAG TPA: glycosyltransferase family 9 protein, partial [Rhodocyclaceae bacterium]|nr:glycosyltransferase family 9 protein [Rhodocyclaceae bacterium]
AILSDGGAMHLAAGLGKPVVALFGATPPAVWRPWGVTHRVLRPPSREVRELDAAAIVDACFELPVWSPAAPGA